VDAVAHVGGVEFLEFGVALVEGVGQGAGVGGFLLQAGLVGGVGGVVGLGGAQGGGLVVVGGGLAGAGEFVADVAWCGGQFAVPGGRPRPGRTRRRIRARWAPLVISCSACSTGGWPRAFQAAR
jgi:hypothetical protein